MSRKTIALSLDNEIYEEYKSFCRKNSIILSRKIDEFMKTELLKKENQK